MLKSTATGAIVLVPLVVPSGKLISVEVDVQVAGVANQVTCSLYEQKHQIDGSFGSSDNVIGPAVANALTNKETIEIAVAYDTYSMSSLFVKIECSAINVKIGTVRAVVRK
jgi:hypothetical protein